ncbi:hypothetical protein ASZ78_000854 [Callipepla squamata]|uniref:Securin n=1 Tax=Callipepla squamata TaxID=9009 RepID=A0A226MRR2_CALSU|nr:hypothetical protein ASZ78_000854 [Callipepla squamata]
MATLVFAEKENGDAAAAESRLRRHSVSCVYMLWRGAKVLSGRRQVSTPLQKKTIRTTPATSHSVRKALGNVNRTVGVVSKKEQMREKNQPRSAKRVAEKTVGLESWDAVGDEACPEMESMFPSDPLDFESFDVHEEHTLNNIGLYGVPLMLHTSTCDEPVNLTSSPVKPEEMLWESDLPRPPTDFLSTLEDIIDMPPMNCLF